MPTFGIARGVIESRNRLNISAMFAALLLLSMLGLVIFGLLNLLQYLLLRRWHECALGREL